jgi:hypothetical protein
MAMSWWVMVVSLILLVLVIVLDIILGKPTRKIGIKRSVNLLFYCIALLSLCVFVPVMLFCLMSSDYLVTSHLYITDVTIIMCLYCFAEAVKIFVVELVIFVCYVLLKRRAEFERLCHIVFNYELWKYTIEERLVIRNDDLKFMKKILLKSPKWFSPLLNRKIKKMEDRIYWMLMTE